MAVANSRLSGVSDSRSLHWPYCDAIQMQETEPLDSFLDLGDKGPMYARHPARRHVRVKPQFTVISNRTAHVDTDIATGVRNGAFHPLALVASCL
jgi:hypothetical protein